MFDTHARKQVLAEVPRQGKQAREGTQEQTQGPSAAELAKREKMDQVT